MDGSSQGGGSGSGEFNAIATLTLTPFTDAIKGMFHDKAHFPPAALIVAFCYYWIMAVITYGVAVPSGLFVPCLLMGSAWGRSVIAAIELVWKIGSGTIEKIYQRWYFIPSPPLTPTSQP